METSSRSSSRSRTAGWSANRPSETATKPYKPPGLATEEVLSRARAQRGLLVAHARGAHPGPSNRGYCAGLGRPSATTFPQRRNLLILATTTVEDFDRFLSVFST